METVYFSPSKSLFYPSDFIEIYKSAGSFPDDLIEPTTSELDEYFCKTAPVDKILGTVSGRPSWVDLAISEEEQWINYQSKAKTLLDETSVTMERITEGVALGTCVLTNADVIDFMKYRQELRVIVKATSGDPTKELPAHPGYPAGT